MPNQNHPHNHLEGGRSHRIHGLRPGYVRGREGENRTLLDKRITTDIPGYRNFIRMEPAFFYLKEERITQHLRKSETNFRKPLEVVLKLAVTLRHYPQEKITLHCSITRGVEGPPSLNSYPRSAKPSNANFIKNIIDLSHKA